MSVVLSVVTISRTPEAPQSSSGLNLIDTYSGTLPFNSNLSCFLPLRAVKR